MKKDNSRRTFIKNSALLAVAGAGLHLAGNKLVAASGLFPEDNAFTLPPLPYSFDALEPNIDKQTMEIHHDKHHQGYVNNLNKLLSEASVKEKSLESIVKNVSKYSAGIRNNAGGHFNHSLFWKIMSPAGGGEPTGAVADAITASFGSFTSFREKFSSEAKSRFGSGWAWLVDNNGKLEVGSTPNQDNPLMDISEFKGKPLLLLDVWEHAYYLKYQNKRGDYINAFWNVVNWGEVNRLMKA